jgi:hypothetical protein
MKIIISAFLSVLCSFEAFSYNLDNLNLEGQWQLKGSPVESKEKILYDFDLKKTLSEDADGFRLSYFESRSLKRGIRGVGLFVLPSCHYGRYNYFLRVNRTDHSFKLFEIIDTKGSPQITTIRLKKNGGPRFYTLEKVIDPITEKKLRHNLPK